jgi:hypothetical protein
MNDNIEMSLTKLLSSNMVWHRVAFHLNYSGRSLEGV